MAILCWGDCVVIMGPVDTHVAILLCCAVIGGSGNDLRGII